MSLLLPNIPFNYMAKFPSSAAGLLSDVVYTIYNDDGSVRTAQTNSGIYETQDGSYGVKLTLPSGGYSISWKIINTRYTASEDININDFTGQEIVNGYPVTNDPYEYDVVGGFAY